MTTTSLRQPKQIHLKILLGTHDFNMVDDVVKAASDCDLLFIEYMAQKDMKDSLENFANDLTLSSRFDPKNFNGEAIKNSQNALFRIFWRLRKHDMLVRLVDKTLRDDEDGIVSYDAITDDMIEQLLTTGDFKRFYERVDKNAALTAQNIHDRDRTVARQVAANIKQFQRANPDSPINAVLLQGLMHNSLPLLQKLLPDARIEKSHYNVRLNDSAMELPSNRITVYKLHHPRAKIKIEDADLHLLVLLEVGIHAITDEEFTAGPRTSITSTDFRTHFIFNFLVENKQKFEKLSAAELHALVVQRLSDFKAALVDYDKHH